MLDRKPIFDEVRQLLGRSFNPQDVARIDAAIDRALGTATEHVLGNAGRLLIKTWEGCAKKRADGRFDAYPDPGSSDGLPWTIGWGSTGTDIGPDTVWTLAECDARFTSDIQRYVDAVAQFIGTATTTPNQFDALVSFHYNTGAIAGSTLGKLHRQGQFAEAQQEFGKWVYNDHKVLEGLKKRRAAEAALYGKP
ncbi:lysozyme [Novosphingobium sp. BL-8A]|uniref:lysozyme n=1 Tax=Novosphingobium sp. BL-8A TaxID=3127639 RepID=UPI003756E148